MRRKEVWKWAICLALICLAGLRYNGHFDLRRHHKVRRHRLPHTDQHHDADPQKDLDLHVDEVQVQARALPKREEPVMAKEHIPHPRARRPDDEIELRKLPIPHRRRPRVHREQHHGEHIKPVEAQPDLQRELPHKRQRQRHHAHNGEVDGEFVPSFEWQTVENGQSVPAGLEISIDLQTGLKRARLMKSRPGIMLPSEIKREKQQKLKLMQELSEIGEFQRVHCDTTFGDVVIELRFDWAPLGAARFAEMIEEGFMTNNIIYRVPPINEMAIAQFGLVPNKQLDRKFSNQIQDDPLRDELKKGYITFAGGGVNTRTTQMYVARTDTTHLGHSPFETPVAHIVQGLEALNKLFVIGDMPPWGKAPSTSSVYSDKTFYSDFPGDYIRNNYPNVDYWKSCTFV